MNTPSVRPQTSSPGQTIQRISIGMPVYNGERYLGGAFDSLLTQTEANFELIVSDNASTDATERICREYAAQDSRIRYIRQPGNIGVMLNFEFVLNQARGEYFMWTAHDDRWSANWLAELLAAHRERVAVTFGEVQITNLAGEVIRSCRNLSFSGDLIARSLRYAFQDEFEGKANLFYGLFKTGILAEVLRQNRLGREYAVDALFLFSVLQKGEILAVNGPSIYKRVGGVGDRVSRNYSMMSRLTAFYLVPYYFGYVRRASTLVLKCMLLAGMPLLLARAYLTRLNRLLRRPDMKQGSDAL